MMFTAGNTDTPAHATARWNVDATRAQWVERRNQVDVLADQIATFAARLDAGEHTLLTTIRKFDELRGWMVQGARSCAAWLSYRIGIGLNTARERVRVANALGELPLIDDALRRGRLSYAKTRAMTRVATPANEELLLAQATGTTGAQLERICARFRRYVPGALTSEDTRYVRRRTSRDGTVKIEMSLLPDEAERVWQALREQRDELRQTSSTSAADGPTLADAAVELAKEASAKYPQGPAPSAQAQPPRTSGGQTLFVHLIEEQCQCPDGKPSVPEATKKISAEASPPDRDIGAAEQRRFRAELDDGTPICSQTLRRMACDAGLVMVNHGSANQGHGALDVGRKTRAIPPAIARALHVRDRTCRFPGCTHRAFLDAHHIDHWSNGGATSLNNLVRLCHFHHVAVHEGGFDVRQATAGPAFFDREGRRIPDVAELPEVDLAAPIIEQLALEQARDDIHIDEHSLLPRRHGLPPREIDLDGCVRALIRRSDYAGTT